MALVSLQGAHQFLGAARDPPWRPLVVGGQPVQHRLVQLCEADCRPPSPLIHSCSLCNRRPVR